MSKSTCDWVTHQLWWSARSSLCERKNIAWMWHWPRTRPPLSTTSAAHRKHVHINDLYYHMCMYINLDTYKLQINMLYIYICSSILNSWIDSPVLSGASSNPTAYYDILWCFRPRLQTGALQKVQELTYIILPSGNRQDIPSSENCDTWEL